MKCWTTMLLTRVRPAVWTLMGLVLALVLVWQSAASAQAAAAPVYRCPGNPVLYTDALSAKEAKDKGCRTLEGAPITIIQGPAPKVVNTASSSTAKAAASSAGAASRPAEARVDPADQKARDTLQTHPGGRVAQGRRAPDRVAKRIQRR